MTPDLKILKRIRKRMKEPKNWEPEGICGLYHRELRKHPWNCYEPGLRKTIEKWPDHSGCAAFPVSGWDSSPMGAYYAATTDRSGATMWDKKNHVYARRRWELLEWLIKQAKQEEKMRQH